MGSRGFTLIELLVALVIVGVITGMAVLAVRGDSLEEIADEELRRLAALMTLAGEQAVLEGREYGVRIDRNGYGFARYEDGNWSRIEDDELLRPRNLSRGLFFTLEVDGRSTPLKQGSEEGEPPQLFLFSSGERNAFQLRIAPPDRLPILRLIGSSFDEYKVETVGYP